MLRSERIGLSIALAVFLHTPSAWAQAASDRRVGPAEFEQPLIVTKVDGQTIGMLARAAGVPMGFEGLPPLKKPLSIRATNRPLRDVLDAIVEADRRYEWRGDDSVIVLRPVDAWNNERSGLNIPVNGVTLTDVAANELFGVLTRMVGVSVTPSQGVGDTHRFSVDIPANSTRLQALNAIVRAHGTLTWALQPSTTSDRAFPISLTLFVGSTGVGFGIPASAMNRSKSVANAVPERVEARKHEPSRFDRIVGARADGRPVVAVGIGWGARELADAVGVPMGLEWLPPTERRPLLRPGFDGVKLTGMTLHYALNRLVALDPRYEWRDLDGVIVFRPVRAWLDSSNPLFRQVEGMRFDEASGSKVIGTFASLLGAPEHTRNSFPDTRTFSIDFPQGSVLDLLNDIVRAHGEMCWEWEEHTPADKKAFGGRRYTVRFSILGGGGLGLMIP